MTANGSKNEPWDCIFIETNHTSKVDMGKINEKWFHDIRKYIFCMSFIIDQTEL